MILLAMLLISDVAMLVLCLAFWSSYRRQETVSMLYHPEIQTFVETCLCNLVMFLTLLSSVSMVSLLITTLLVHLSHH